MPLEPAITDLEQLKNHPAIAKLMAWNPAAVEGAKFDRDEISIYVERSLIRDACMLLRDDPDCPFNYLADVTCVDWFPSEPRFEVVYHLLSHSEKRARATEGSARRQQPGAGFDHSGLARGKLFRARSVSTFLECDSPDIPTCGGC